MKNKYRIIEAQGHYARNRYLTIYRIVCDWDGRACQMSGEYRTRREACAAIAKLKIAQCEKEAKK